MRQNQCSPSSRIGVHDRPEYAIPSPSTNEPLSNEDLDDFKELFLKPCFVRAQNEILNKFGDRIELSSIKLKNGSIYVDVGVYLVTLAKDPLVVGTLATILGGLLLKKISSPDQRKEHLILMEKISAILESHTRNIAGQDFNIEDNYFPIYDPKLKQFKVIKFTFHSKQLDRLNREVHKAIESYHNRIGK